MGDFELDTRVEGSDGSYRATLSQDWEVWGPNGGYLAAIALRAAGREARIPRPASFTGHFIRVASFDRVDLEVVPVHRGRRAESIHVVMRQQGKPVLQAAVRTAAEGPRLEHDFARMPDVPPPETLKGYGDLFPDGEPPYRFWYNLETRIIDLDRVLEGPKAAEPRFREWYRFVPRATFDDPFVDAGRQLLLLDTLAWPAAARPHPEAAFQAPNLDVAAWFHQPAEGSEWLLSEHESLIAKGALMNATGRVWSRDGRLLATGGAQLLCVPIGAGVPPPAPRRSENQT